MMHVTLKDFLDDENCLKFTIFDVDVAFVNAIRRTILSDIDVCCIKFNSPIIITANTGRLHNEILKHRLSCIPIHVKNEIKNGVVCNTMEKFCEEYTLEIDCINETDVMKIVTTEDFRIKHIGTGEYLDDVKNIFPPNALTHDYIDLSRLRARISESIPGESLKISAPFSISNSTYNSTHNAVSKCTYSNTLDLEKGASVWNKKRLDLRSRGKSEDIIRFEKTNFYHSEAHRYFIPGSFDFTIQSVGVLSNREILTMANLHLVRKFIDFIRKIDEKSVPILISETTTPFSFDIELLGEDHTFGNIVEYLLYTHYYKSKALSYCGFKKFHPHDSKSTIRIAFYHMPEADEIADMVKQCCHKALDIFHSILAQI